jgi:transposase-like protein
VADVCRQLGVSEASFYLWRKKYGRPARKSQDHRPLIRATSTAHGADRLRHAGPLRPRPARRAARYTRRPCT